MIIVTGKYRKAHIMIDHVDESSMAQIQQFVNSPSFEMDEAFDGEFDIVIMPDCHAGAGCCIGFTMRMNHDKVIPNVIGVDIGCGMLAYDITDTNLLDNGFEEFDRHLRNVIPFGFDIHENEVASQYVSRDMLDTFEETSRIVGQKGGKVLNSIGSLGGGNHFIEITELQDESKILVIHSGSRNFGLCIANHHQKIAQSLNPECQKQLAYLYGDYSKQYLTHMGHAQTYASLNRLIMMRRLIGDDYIELDDCVECVHNYINFDDGFIRKGAISAHLDEDVIIPLNMRDGVIFGKGCGKSEWNYSAPHGAGRIYSRSKAKQELSLEEFQSDMEGVWSSCIKQSTLDECPRAYKSKDDILKCIIGNVIIEDIGKPVYNFKG